MLSRHVFLIGMAGSGKSTLGKRVAGNMALPYIDTDRRISELLNMTIPDIFIKLGEAAFRNAETNYLMSLLDVPPAIVSTGGACVLTPINYQIMHNHGIIILIDRPPEDIMQDIRLETRPMLKEKGVSEVPKMYMDRIDRYRAAADVTLNNAYGYHNALFMLEKIIKSRFSLDK